MDIVSLAVILWVVPIFVARAQGKAKRRDGILYGMALGWIGVFVLAVLPPRPPRPVQRKPVPPPPARPRAFE